MKLDPADDTDRTGEVDVSGIRPDPLDVKKAEGVLHRAVRAFERAGDTMREGVDLLKKAINLLEKYENGKAP